MTSKRLYYTLLGLIVVLILGLVGGAYGMSLLIASHSKELVNNRLQVAVLTEEQSQLTKARQDLKKYQDLGTIAESVVPQDKDEAQTVRQVVDIANANGISLSSVSFPASTLGTTSSGGSKQLSQLTPVKGITGVYTLQLTVQSDNTKPVPYNQFLAFLSSLEHNRRTAQVTTISIQPDDKNRSTVSFNLVLNEYIKP